MNITASQSDDKLACLPPGHSVTIKLTDLSENVMQALNFYQTVYHS